MERLTRMLQGLGPSMPRPALTEALRAATGAGFGLLVTGLILWLFTPGVSLLDHPLLIAPFAASAVLIFAVPNSPLAQPWAVVVGNTVSALCGIAVVHLGLHALLAVAVAVLAAIAATAAMRALHPPGGATAMAMVLMASPDHPMAWGFAFSPVLVGSALLALCGIVWNRSTGRVYPFRLKPAAPHGTADKTPDRRQTPPDAVLAATLQRLRLGANIGVEDLARLIAGAEAGSAAATLGQITAADMMSRDLITVRPDADLPELATQFRTHRFKSLPIQRADGSYGGLVPIGAMVGQSDPALRADGLTDPHIQTARADAPVSDLIDLLADGRQQTVPILRDNTLLGLVTRSDLIALMIHAQSHA